MDIFDHEINKRIIYGRFPSEELVSANIEDILPINFKEYKDGGLKLLGENKQFLPALFALYEKRLTEFSSDKDFFNGAVVNCLINTGYDMEMLNENKPSYHKVISLIPFVTKLDSVLWFAASSAYDSCLFIEEGEVSNVKAMLYTWIYLLHVLEEKEEKYKVTIKDEVVFSNESVIEIILGDWDSNNKKIFVPLKEIELTKLSDLLQKRTELLELVKTENKEEKEYAAKTVKEWETFLSIINDLSQKEEEGFERLLAPLSPKKKLNALNEYENTIRDIKDKKRYIVDGIEINLEELFESILERYKNAAPYCKANTPSGTPFRIHYALLNLAMEPRTYNYYLMKFHQLRLNPGKDGARKFAELALYSLCRNLEINYKETVSVDEMIEQYYQIVEGYVKDNQDIIEELRFDKIQIDAISVLGFSQQLFIEQTIIGELKKQYAIDKKKTFGDLWTEDFEEEMIGWSDKENKASIIAKARQIIVSLNMIYLFANAIGIMIEDKHISVINNKEKAEKYRYGLLKIVSRLVAKVYSDIPDEEMDMYEYREKNAIDTMLLSEKERYAEEHSNDVFAGMMQTNISKLVKDLSSADIDKLLMTKRAIIDEIAAFPLCRDKELYAEWVDQICSDLCYSMVEVCKKHNDDYDELKNSLKKSLGKGADVLPEATVDSLTTAEMLYHRYALEEYAGQGFDYSSISALYYQAFETAYNKLMWEGFADILNTTNVDDQPFIEIVTCTKKGFNKEFENTPKYHKYLGKNIFDARNYVRYKSKEKGIDETTFTPYCMYKLFSCLLKNIRNDQLGTEFNVYVSRIIGFSNPDEMNNDVGLMDMLEKLGIDIEKATGHRNNASHGGTLIDIHRCTEDKKTVLDNLDAIRSDSMGLIEQLIGIMTYKKQ